MLSEMELLIINKSIESFEHIINQIHCKFEEFKNRDEELILEVVTIATDYKKDVVRFYHVVLDILINEENSEVRNALNIINSKIITLDEMIDSYAPKNFFEKPTTTIYS